MRYSRFLLDCFCFPFSSVSARVFCHLLPPGYSEFTMLFYFSALLRWNLCSLNFKPFFFLMEVFTAMSVPLSPALAASQKYYTEFSFSLWLKYFPDFSIISSFTHKLFRSISFHFSDMCGFPSYLIAINF